MLDRKFIRENRKALEKALEAKRVVVDLDRLYALDADMLRIKQELEGMKRRHNELSGEVAKLKKEGKDAGEIVDKVKSQDKDEKHLSEKSREVEIEYTELASWLPNIPHESTPVGADDADNQFVRNWGEKPEFGFKPKAHWEIGESLEIIDFKRATKMSGARFNIMRGNGALMERALITFMLDKATRENSYEEIYPPCLVTRDSMFRCAQLPKLEEDMYRMDDGDIFLIPTAEVVLMNYRAEETIDRKDLPVKYTAYTPSFRREAGSYGKDTRGVIRQHQFDKVELFQLTKADGSYDALEEMVTNSESVLQALGLHYQVVLKCSGDISFASTKSYDLEVWMPGHDKYVEIASISNCTDFQARRAMMKYRDEDKKMVFVHTLNGSGLAVGRTWAAILENYQQEDGRVVLPNVLRDYMGGMEALEPIKEEKKGE